MHKSLGFFSLLFAALTYGSFGIWIRLLNKEMSIYQQIVLRNVFAFAIAIIIFLLIKQTKKIDWKETNKASLFFYIFLIPLAVIAYNISILNTKIALATFAVYIGIILSSWIAGILFFKEKLSIEKWLSLILVLIGLALFAYPFNKSSINVGFLAGLVSGILDGAANGFRKNLSDKVNKLTLILLTTIGGVFVSGLMISYSQQNIFFFNDLSTTAWIVGAMFGALLVVINYLLLIGFQNFDLGMGSVILSLELLFALIFGIIVFKEYPLSRELIGGFLILIANIIPNFRFLLKKH